MRIALDYDNTYTAHPEFWLAFIDLAKNHGHECKIVTVRDDRYDRTATIIEVEQLVDVIYTRGVAKEHFLLSDPDAAVFKPDIWVDDKVKNILFNSATTPEGLATWRAERGEGPSFPLGARP